MEYIRSLEECGRADEASDPLHNESHPDLHWSVDNIGEALPGLLTPLGWTLWRESVDHAGRQSAYTLGVLSRSEHTRPPDDRLMVQAFYGRAGMQLEFYGLIGDRMPGTTGADVVAGILGRVPEDMAFHPTRRRYPFIAVRLPWTLFTAPRRARAMAAETDDWWRRELERIPHLDLAQTVDAFMEAQRRFSANQVMQGVIVFGVVGPLFQGLGQLVEAAGVGDIAALSGSGGAEMAIIADIWRASRDELSLDEVVANHGFHGPLEGEISSCVWREDPAPLVQTIKEYAARDDSTNPIARQEEALRRLPEFQAEVLAALPRSKRPAARLLLRLAAAGIPMRGVSKRAFLQSIDVARCAARHAGDLLAEQGVLADPEDVFYLTTDELTGRVPEDVTGLVRRRRQWRDQYATLELPLTWKGTPVPAAAATPQRTADVVTGLGVSAGVVEGTVRVVFDPSFADVRPDEVLVAPMTDPSWSSIMFISAALVVDIGGALSHAAVVARELGFPCVVNTRTGTRDLRTGDRVRVDGTKGTVEILERGEA